MVRRTIVEIDEAKCDGCGLCVPSCAEGAIQIVNGKARLVSDRYCDGLGACLGYCPQRAITVVEREADPFDESLLASNHPQPAAETSLPIPSVPARPASPPAMQGCPGVAVRVLDQSKPAGSGATGDPHRPPSSDRTLPCPSALAQWPVQLRLVPPSAPFLQGADLLLVADCVPFALADFHRRFLTDHAVVVACPKLDDAGASLDRLSGILAQSNLRRLTVLQMEVPCCRGLLRMADTARQMAGSQVPLEAVTISVAGEVVA